MGTEAVADLSRIEDLGGGAVRINAADLHYRELNQLLRKVTAGGAKRVELLKVNGQRYIGSDLPPVAIDIRGCAGNNLGAFMNGCDITVYGNCQDAPGNTMNAGSIIVHGHSSDIAGFAMRGGKVFIRDNAGYRCGIHMKEYEDKIPVLVVGGVAHDFLGEYMAGGILIVLNRGHVLDGGHSGPEEIPSHFIGTGMHGGVMYIRGKIEPYQLGKEVAPLPLDETDRQTLRREITAYGEYFGVARDEVETLIASDYVKLRPVSHRPYGKMYAH